MAKSAARKRGRLGDLGPLPDAGDQVAAQKLILQPAEDFDGLTANYGADIVRYPGQAIQQADYPSVGHLRASSPLGYCYCYLCRWQRPPPFTGFRHGRPVVLVGAPHLGEPPPLPPALTPPKPRPPE